MVASAFIPQVAVEKLGSSITAEEFNFYHALDREDAPNTSDMLGVATEDGVPFIMRVLRGPACGGPGMSYTRAAFVEIWDMEGNQKIRLSKGFEPTSVFALRMQADAMRNGVEDIDITRATFRELSASPSFLPSMGVYGRGEYDAEHGAHLLPRRFSFGKPETAKQAQTPALG